MQTRSQELDQVDGPHRPGPVELAVMLGRIPRHMEIRAIAINGQTGTVVIEVYYEGLVKEERFVHRKRRPGDLPPDPGKITPP